MKKNLIIEFARKISIVYHNFRRVIGEEIAQVEGFNPGWLPYIKVISREPGIVLEELAKKLLVSKPAISKTITQLKSAGICMVKNNPNDGRSKQLFLTSKGQELIVKIDPLIENSQKKFLEDISDDEQRELLRILDKLIVQLNK